MRHFGLPGVAQSAKMGHASHARTERPDSVSYPTEEKLTPFQRFILLVGCAASLVLSLSVAHGYYIWLLKP